MIRKLLVLLVVLLAGMQPKIWGQIQDRCGSMEVLDRLMKEDPTLKDRMQQIEMDMQNRIISGEGQFTGGVIRRIPVVVHVVYKTTAQNISDAQVQSQITVLNEDYRKMFGTNGYNTNPVGADTEIEFYLATTDPNGNPTNGITRRLTTVTSFSTNDNVKRTANGGTDPWDPAHYLNLWVCNLGSGLLGYAQFPGGPSATDGVVCLYSAFGTTGTVNPPFHLGRTATHEIGHYLNLYHTFQGGCSAPGDYCDDTPFVSAPNYGCPTGHVSCSSVDMVENYMDYTDDACMNIFTINQSSRENATLDGTRSTLWTTGGGGGTNPVAVANGPYAGIEGTAINFSSTGSNDPDGSIVGYLWNFGDGNTSTSANPSYTYAAAGTYNVSLTVTDNDGFTGTANTTATISTVGGNPVVIYSEGFELAGSEVPGANWSSSDLNGTSGLDYWGDQSSGAKIHSGSWSVYCADFSNKAGQVYDNNMNTYATKLTGLGVSGYTDVEFSFWLYYKTKNSADYVALEYLNSSGTWVEAQRWSGTGGTTWSQKVFTLTGFTTFSFRFRFYSNGSGLSEGAYFDDIELSGVPARFSENVLADQEQQVIEKQFGRHFIQASLNRNEMKPAEELVNDFYSLNDDEVTLNKPVESITEYKLSNYPNPFNPSTVIRYEIPAETHVSLKVYDILGNEVANLVDETKSVGSYNAVFDAADLAGGVYIYRLATGNFVETKKMLLVK
ncbi:MAG: PKD domain-containing protein [Ignavibacteriales bacterium]|nr:PKD domain-containing protein [Ignavibacteriales bacterium]